LQRTRALALAICLTMTAMALPAMAWSRDDLPTLSSTPISGAGSVAVKLTTTSESDLVVEANVVGPATSSVVSAGMALVDAQGNPTFAFVFSSVSSPDRDIGLPIESGSLPPGMHLVYGLKGTMSDGNADEACTFLCAAIESDGQAAGTYYFVAWIGGGSGGDVNVKANGGSVSVNTGVARTAGDSDITNGQTNIQYQSGGVGVKIIQGASIPFSAPGATFGLWQDLNLKIVCAAVVCLLPVQNLAELTGVGTSKISYTGPQSGTGAQTYFLLNAPSGDYTFNVDQKVDVYSAGQQPFICAVGCFGGLILEDFSIFSMASVSLPA
jgi:hypothetical protein